MSTSRKPAIKIHYSAIGVGGRSFSIRNQECQSLIFVSLIIIFIDKYHLPLLSFCVASIPSHISGHRVCMCSVMHTACLLCSLSYGEQSKTFDCTSGRNGGIEEWRNGGRTKLSNGGIEEGGIEE